MVYRGYRVSIYTQFLGLYFLLAILGVVNAFNLGSALKYIAILPLLASLSHFRFRLKRLAAPILLYYIIASVSIIWSINQQETTETSVSFVSFIILIVSVCSKSFNRGEISFLQQSLVWSSRLSVFVTWFFVSYSSGRLLIQGSAIEEDPNYLCAYFYFGIAYCFSQLYSNKKPIIKLVLLFESVFYLFTILATGSRGGLLGAIIVIGIILLKNIQSNFRKSLPLTLFIFLVFGFSLYFALGYENSEVMERYSQEALMESDGSGRYEIWRDAIRTYGESTFSRQVFGYGMGASRTVAQNFHFSRVNVMHNVLLESLIGLGLIGLILYIVSLVCLFIMSSKYPFAISVFMGVFVLSMSTSILYLKPYWNIVLFIICYHYLDNKSTSV